MQKNLKDSSQLNSPLLVKDVRRNFIALIEIALGLVAELPLNVSGYHARTSRFEFIC